MPTDPVAALPVIANVWDTPTVPTAPVADTPVRVTAFVSVTEPTAPAEQAGTPVGRRIVLGMLGLVYLVSFITVRGISDDVAYRAAIAMAAVGADTNACSQPYWLSTSEHRNRRLSRVLSGQA